MLMELELIIQHNCRRSWKVWHKLEVVCGDREPCCLLIQEPPMGRDGQPAQLQGYLRIVPGTDRDTVGMYIREGTTCGRMPISQEGWIVFALLKIGATQLVVGSLYLTPSEGIR